ncbi:STAS domain-containing protein [Haliovirga abyssi]|uniref:STAS domain-containing protein n=1 Tax=Haliovirga abyssi TaxID=2996794 RepID=A0AAU9D6H4_9FUSO|nr:STAS domain-containing protein [Haliovirga abyssi]BDU50148.1 hypothetical protein HLVA_07170 [Haliovirga abyssi]
MNNGNKIKVEIKGNRGYIILDQNMSSREIRDLRKVFEELEQKDIIDIYIDMNKVYHIDSSGIGIFVMYLKKLKEKNGNLSLISPTEDIKRILKLVNLISYFDIIE